uniref:flavin reductase family protein n=1 Tax=uncultured Sphingomonas sp. TaxID=158754 RepID=UPI0035CAAF1D
MVDSAAFRRTLGHYPTGVCAITSLADGRPVGMTVGSFTSMSLEPPLVGFFPDKRSTSWKTIRSAARFCVNVLADDQQDVCRALSSKVADKFSGIDYLLSNRALPQIQGAAAWIECDLYAEYEVGDHFVAIGQVASLAVDLDCRPLLFLKGEYREIGPGLPSTSMLG